MENIIRITAMDMPQTAFSCVNTAALQNSSGIKALRDWYWNRLEETRWQGIRSITLPAPEAWDGLLGGLSANDEDAPYTVLKTISHWCFINPKYGMDILLAVSNPDAAKRCRTILSQKTDAWNHPLIPEENNGLLELAITFAMDRHKGSTRKGTRRPYILHPLTTLQILVSMEADFNLMAAGVLHDTLEDTDTTLLELYDQFGADIAALINGHTEDKRNAWQERKLQNINNLAHAGLREKMLVIADKVANLRDMDSDYQKVGEALWLRFNAPKQKQSWYYGHLTEGLKELADIPQTQKIYQEMTSLYHKLFA